MADIIMDNPKLQEGLTQEELGNVIGNIAHHMGAWVFDYKTHQKILDEPVGKMQNFVHLVDYLASRKCLEFNFDVKIERE
jgi:hypothetical protein